MVPNRATLAEVVADWRSLDLTFQLAIISGLHQD